MKKENLTSKNQNSIHNLLIDLFNKLDDIFEELKILNSK